MPLQFTQLSSTSLREVIAGGKLPELEYGLLQRHGEKLRWTSAEKALLCRMQIDVLEAKLEHSKLEVVVRSFCHARDAVSDHLRQDERFNTKRSILLIGDIGLVPEPWAGLVQAALYLHAQGFNVINIEVPEYKYSTPRYLKYGAAIFNGVLDFMSVCEVCTLACGNGGALLFETIAQHRQLFGNSHFVFNLNCPPGTKKAQFPIVKLEEHLRGGSLQFWFGFQDEEGVYSRYEPGTAKRSYEAITGMQTRLEGQRRRGRRLLDYDEVLVTETLNLPRAVRVKRVPVGRNALVVFADAILESLWRFFFAHKPSQTQDNLQDGLVPDMKVFGQILAGEELPELPAMRALRIGNDVVAAEQEAVALKKAESLPALRGGRRPSAAARRQEKQERRISTMSSNGTLVIMALDARGKPMPQVDKKYVNERRGSWTMLATDDEIAEEADDSGDEGS